MPLSVDTSELSGSGAANIRGSGSSMAGRWGSGGGGAARWNRDGGELFYVSGNRIMTVPVRTRPALDVGRPTPLFEIGTKGWADFDVSPDGKRFLAVVPQKLVQEQPLTVVLNWRAEVRK